MIRSPPKSPPFPSTTLFRSEVLAGLAATAAEALFRRHLPPAQAALEAHALPFGLAAAVLFLRQAIDPAAGDQFMVIDRKSTRLNSSHANISYAVFCLKKKKF